MKFFSGILLFIILFLSCTKNSGKPAVLPQNKMTAVMWDIIRADQYVSDFLLRDSTRNKKAESIRLYDEIFHIHKITQQQFKKSLEYYSSRPDLFQPIVDSLAKRKNESSPFLPARPIKKDSLIRSLQRKPFSKQ